MNQWVEESKEGATADSLAWFKAQLDAMHSKSTHVIPSTEELERITKEQRDREAALTDLKRQQEEIAKKIEDLQVAPNTGMASTLPSTAVGKDNQGDLMAQLRTALSGKKEEDQNKTLLKALVTHQNKMPGEGGTNTLKPSIVRGVPEMNGGTMADWLANLNKQEEGESDLLKYPLLGEDDSAGRQARARSGMLDGATANIQEKQVWPQQNLGEDWADEDIDFKQLKFGHLVVGETRTIETCTDPAKILGRLRLLRRVAYLKLRGYEWNLIRKMYAAILTSIETKEYSWESNFDRFQTILYRRMVMEGRTHHTDTRTQDREQGGRKRFCRDYNKPEGCPWNSPHTVWFRNGNNAVKRTVYHYCAACLIRDK